MSSKAAESYYTLIHCELSVAAFLLTRRCALFKWTRSYLPGDLTVVFIKVGKLGVMRCSCVLLEKALEVAAI